MLTAAAVVKSKATISKAEDKETGNAPNGPVDPGVSLRHGPVQDEDVHMGASGSTKKVNGIDAGSKRKSRVNGASYKDPTSSEDDEDQPLSKKRKTSVNVKQEQSESDLSDAPLVSKNGHRAKKPPKASPQQIGEDSEDDVPLTKKLSTQKAKIEKKAEQTAKKLRAEEQKKPAKKATPNKVKKEESDDEPLQRKKKATTPSKSAKPTESAKKKAKAKEVKKEETELDVDEEDDEEEYRWWEQQNPTGDGTRKWNTLEHNGVVFPPNYEPLPKNVKLHYDGAPVSLKPEAEEVATFYGSMLHSTVNVENPTFNKNFFDDFKKVLDKTGHATDKNGNQVKIKTFEKCNFRPIFEHFDAERAAKKAKPPAEKKAEKAEKDVREAPYAYCKWDGRKQKVGNFRVEPPGLFRGRGEHPKTGRIKRRVQPEQITINIGENVPVPAPPAGHKWKEVRHDHEGTWLAMWQENINNAYKYVMLAANSDIKGQSDYKKFEKARELKKHIDKIRKDYGGGLKSQVMADRQRATAMYLIDRFALRAGNEKGEDEADTVGCCSLKYEHVTLKPPKTVVFDFLGKDSIRFYEEFDVDEQVFKNLQIFKKSPKGPGDEIFDRLTTSALNKHLNSYMAGLTAKVFRTYNASFMMSMLLRDLKSTGTIPEKVKDYNDANRRVAILCNHKRTVAAGHENQMEKLEDKINGLRYQQWRLRKSLLNVEPKLKKKRGDEYFALPEDLDQEWVQKHIADLVQEQNTKIEKKFNKENEKLKEEGQKEMKHKELEERLQVAKDLEKKLKGEAKSGKVEAEGKAPSIEKIDEQLKKLDQRVENMRIQSADKENTKEVALGTSKIVSISASPSILGADHRYRTISILDSRLSSPRSLMCPSNGSSPSLSERSLTGLSSLSKGTGNSEETSGGQEMSPTRRLRRCEPS